MVSGPDGRRPWCRPRRPILGMPIDVWDLLDLLTFTPLSLVQIEQLQFVRQQLCSPGLGPEGQPVPPEGALAPEQQAAEFRSGAAVSSAGESTLRPGDSEVSRGLVSHSEGERLDGRTRTRTLV